MNLSNPDDWARIEAILDVALDLSHDQREAFVIDACDDDSDLRDQILGLLREARQVEESDFLEESVGVHAMNLVKRAIDEQESPAETELQQVGPYRIEAEIGRGGMGRVYLGRRVDGAIEQDVAIKFVRVGNEPRKDLERFQAEAQILAGLNHPGIARFYETGTASNGDPYFVMEYIDGVPITSYCDQHDLDITSRLQLFKRLCDAVAYAQQQLVVQCDLKPDNILVTDDGRVKLLDFGISKVIAPDVTELTQTRTRILTPAYAAPEQLSSGRITTATDVYSLGVVLYELLTGQMPYDSNKAELVNARSDRQPRPPSSVVGIARDRVAEKGDMDRAQVRRQRRRLRRDLDAVILKALRPDPEMRYPTVAALAEDISRSLSQLPVNAKSGHRLYIVARFLKRRRLRLLTAAAVVLLATGFVWRLVIERHEARIQATRAERVSNFLEGLFQSASPATRFGTEAADWFEASPDDTLTVLDLLNRGKARLRYAFVDEPEVRWLLEFNLGEIFKGLGHFEQAESSMKDAVRLARDTYGPSSGQTISSMASLASILIRVGRYREVDSLQRVGLERLERASMSDPDRAFHLINWADRKLMLGDLDGADRMVRDAMSLSGVSDRQLGRGYTLLSWIMLYRGEFFAAEKAARLGESRMIAADGGTPYHVFEARHPLALALGMLGELDESSGLYRELLDDATTLFGATSGKRITVLNGFAVVEIERGRYAAAESLLTEALAISRRSVGPNELMGVVNLNLGIVVGAGGDSGNAAAYSAEGLKILRELHGENHHMVARARRVVADQLGKPGDASSLARAGARMPRRADSLAETTMRGQLVLQSLGY